VRSGLYRRDERGAVVIMVALWLPLLALLATFGVDVGHWFDYKRSLQSRADAIALAVGSAYGGDCFAPGGPTTTALHTLGYVGQRYSGADQTTPGLPYTPWSVALAPGQTQYYNSPTLAKGKLSDYHVLFNAKDYWENGPAKGGTNFSMAADGSNSDTAFCNSVKDNYDVGAAYDQCGVSKHCGIFDVKVTQADLGLFFPLPFKVVPAIHAHARVEIQQVGAEKVVRAIAVRDANSTKCVDVEFHNANDGSLITKVALLKETSGSPGGPVVWDNPAGNDVPIPNGANVYVRPYLSSDAVGGDGHCVAGGDYFDASSGISYINSYGTGTSSPDQAPQITTGGVSAVASGCAPDQYFSTSTGCTASLVAHISIASDVNKTKFTPTITDTSTGVQIDMRNAGGNTWQTSKDFKIDLASGRHPFQISWDQEDGSINGTACGNGTPGKPPPCKGTFPGQAITDFGGASYKVQQEVFAACYGCDDPDDSGPVILAQLGEGASILTNAFQGGTTHKLIVKLEIQTLQNSQPGDPPIVLRYNTATNHQTGLIDCGQGSGNDITVITIGCPVAGSVDCPSSSNSWEYCAPFKINERSDVCTPSLRTTDPSVKVDCVDRVDGSRSQKIPGAIASLLSPGGNCVANNWGSTIPDGDPRALTMVITSPQDLNKNGVPTAIHNFATFYVTGWDTSGSIPNCTPAGTNEPYPGSSKASKGAIWGHWIKYVDPNAQGTGKFCDPAIFGNCVAVLTR
jgi:hypothetical protein